MNTNVKFIICALGIFLSYFYFGILQEKVTKGTYPVETHVESPDGNKVIEYEKYTYALSLVFCQCFVGYLFAYGASLLSKSNEDRNVGLTTHYAGCALTYLLAMVCSNMSLQWIPYPTQVVGKAVKPIPIMLLGVLIAKKSYSMKKYVFILLVVIGVVLFMYKDKGQMSQNETFFGFGELLLIMSLVMDGLTGGIQEIIRAQPVKPSGEQMMQCVNFWASVYLIIGLIFSGEGIEFISFVNRHPIVMFNLATLSLAAAVGQHFIYMMVANFGPLPVSVVTTTRKFVTVLTSVLFFGNTLSTRQWFGTVIVFIGLSLDAYYSKAKGSQTKPGKEVKH